MHFNILKEIFFPSSKSLDIKPNPLLDGASNRGPAVCHPKHIKKCSNSTLFQAIYDYPGMARKRMSILGEMYKGMSRQMCCSFMCGTWREFMGSLDEFITAS